MNGLTLQLEVVSPEGPAFFITTEPAMPQVKLRARVLEWDAKANQCAQFQWNVALEHQGGQCAHMQAFNASKHDPISAKSIGGDWTIPLRQLRGGKLSLTASVTGKSAKGLLTALCVSSQGLRINGTNPSPAELSSAIPNDVLKRIARHESSLRQFLQNRDGLGACPYFSEDNAGGVGLFQITHPHPAPEMIWNWRENLAAAIALYHEKRATAKNYPALCRKELKYENLVKDFVREQKRLYVEAKSKANPNAKPADLAPPEISVVLPDFTDDELSDDTIRGFNCYAGIDNLGVRARLHEFEVPIQTPKGGGNPSLDAKLGADGRTATLEWRRVDIERRSIPTHDRNGNEIRVAVGDPNYVENVKSQQLF